MNERKKTHAQEEAPKGEGVRARVREGVFSFFCAERCVRDDATNVVKRSDARRGSI
jgi:hypothetical protein